MKASDLIKRLEKLPPDMHIGVLDPRENYYTISDRDILISSVYEYDDDENETEIPAGLICTEDDDE